MKEYGKNTRTEKRGPEEVMEVITIDKQHRRTMTSNGGRGRGGDDPFSETLAWVRAKAAERREKYRQRIHEDKLQQFDKEKEDKKAIAAYESVAGENLKRGRAVLADAEMHLKMFEKCLNYQERDEDDDEDDDCEVCGDNGRVSMENVLPTMECEDSCLEREKLSDIDLNAFVTNRSNDRTHEKNPMNIGDNGKWNDNGNTNFKENGSIPIENPAFSLSSNNDTSEDDGSERDLKDAMDYLNNLKLKPRRSYRPPHHLPTPNDINHIIEAGAKIVQREQGIAAARRRGDKIRACDDKNTPPSSHKMMTTFDNNVTSSLMQGQKSGGGSNVICQFDPSQLEGVKRAAITAAKLAEKEAALEADAVQKSNFKARPLPGGVWVPNDPYKPTKAALSKQQHVVVPSRQQQYVQSRGKCKLSPSVELKQRMTAFLQKRGYDVMSIVPCDFDLLDELEDQCKALTCYNLKQHFDDENELVIHYDNRDDGGINKCCFDHNDDICQHQYDLIEVGDDDIPSLHREITKLEALLSQKRKLRFDLQQIARDEDFDPDFNKYIDINKLFKPSADDNDEDDTASEYSENKLMLQDDTAIGIIANYSCVDSDSAVYRRQELWLEDREKKRKQARIQKEIETLESVTGQPQLASAKISWERAKEAHADAARREREEEERRIRDKQNKDDMARQQRMEEINAIQAIAVKKKRAIKSRIDKAKQIEALEKLSRPRITPSAAAAVKNVNNSNDSLDEKLEKRQQQQKNSVNPLGIPNTQHSPSSHNKKEKQKKIKLKVDASNNIATFDGDFSELDDKQFAKVIKSMGLGFSLSPAKNKEMGSSSNEQTTLIEESDASIDDNDDELLMTTDHQHDESEAKDTFGDNGVFNFHRNDVDNISCTAATNTTNDKHEKREPLLLHQSEHKDDAYHYNEYATSTTIPNGASTPSGSNYHKNKAAHDDPPISKMLNTILSYSSQQQNRHEEPYQKYEAGKIPFFDRSSSAEKGRFRVRDARGFAPETMRRRRPNPDEDGIAAVGEELSLPDDDGDDGVMLLVGKRVADGKDTTTDVLSNGCSDADSSSHGTRREVAITIMFDRSRFNEMTAAEWWKRNRHRFVDA
eukprot:CAMPEP_0172490092 /NCGR_PEP_ID=MMETSP1066-20121228/20444_1 /TAXON_ID=671091 /ORGANISM="Coscinodiscus wailesii, Strain CCMP2513" /LENGTH=1100 /DNA_ID=CAMNT_0013258397 /DNA_START=750 /DNA_END=4052 /DNA_ORIENTATION=+